MRDSCLKAQTFILMELWNSPVAALEGYVLHFCRCLPTQAVFERVFWRAKTPKEKWRRVSMLTSTSQWKVKRSGKEIHTSKRSWKRSSSSAIERHTRIKVDFLSDVQQKVDCDAELPARPPRLPRLFSGSLTLFIHAGFISQFSRLPGTCAYNGWSGTTFLNLCMRGCLSSVRLCECSRTELLASAP